MEGSLKKLLEEDKFLKEYIRYFIEIGIEKIQDFYFIKDILKDKKEKLGSKMLLEERIEALLVNKHIFHCFYVNLDGNKRKNIFHVKYGWKIKRR